MANTTEARLQILVTIDYRIGDFAYLKTDPDQIKRIVTGIDLRPGGASATKYVLSCGMHESDHFSFEISKHPAL